VKRINLEPVTTSGRSNSPVDRFLIGLLASGAVAGAQVAIYRGAELLSERTVGRARADRAMTTDTLVPWFSAGKVVSALVAFRCARNGYLSLEDSLSTWLPEVSRAPMIGRIRVRNLLSHSSGLLDASDSTFGNVGQVIATAVANHAVRPGEPGTYCAYTRYIEWYVLSLVLERATGVPIRTLLNDELVCSGARRSAFGFDDAVFDEVEPDITHVYQPGPTDKFIRLHSLRKEATRCDRAGNALGSMNDLARLMTTFQPGVRESYLPEEARRRMTETAAAGTDLYFGIDQTYTLGLMKDLRWRFGDGWSAGSVGHVGSSVIGTVADPNSGLSVAAFFNGRIRSTSVTASTARFRAFGTAVAEEFR
jgi:CubicO group peptidase (beta-lactamase class C family)